MTHRIRTVGLVLICCIALSATACARRTARSIQMPAAAGTQSAKQEKSPRRSEAARNIREAIQSLKKKMGVGADRSTTTTPPNTPGAPTPEVAATEQPGAPAVRGNPDSRGVGTSGAWSMETRYPPPPAATGSAGPSGPQPRGRLLSRAGHAVRQAGGGTWGGVLALCAIAAALVAAALGVRRARHTT